MYVRRSDETARHRRRGLRDKLLPPRRRRVRIAEQRCAGRPLGLEDERVARRDGRIRMIVVCQLVDRDDQPSNVAAERVDPVFVGSPRIHLDQELPVERCDRLERMAKPEDAAFARGGVDAGHRSDVLISHPQSAVGVGLLASAVASLVRVHDRTGVVIDLVHGALRLVGRPEVAPAYCEVRELGLRHGRSRGDRVRLRIDSLDAVTALDPDGPVAEDHAGCVR